VLELVLTVSVADQIQSVTQKEKAKTANNGDSFSFLFLEETWGI
jgi:hypothetical protein